MFAITGGTISYRVYLLGNATVGTSRLDGFKRVTMELLSEQGIDYRTMKCRLHETSMENRKSIGNWSLRLGNWTVWMQMEIGLGGVACLYRVIQFRGSKRGKNKDCFGNKQFFFKSLFETLRPDRSRIRKALLDRGFKFPHRSFEGLLFFSVEPPSGRRFFHEGVDIPHAYEIPDAF